MGILEQMTVRHKKAIEELGALGWRLEGEYKNLDTELSLLCPNNHRVNISLKVWRKKKRCPICAEKEQVLEAEIFPKKEGEKRILALDQATQKTGWSIFSIHGELIKCGLYVAPPGSEFERVGAIRKWLLCMIESWDPDYIFIEDIQLQRKMSSSPGSFDGITTFKILARLQGVLCNVVHDSGAELSLVLSSVWRKTCGIGGKNREIKKANAQKKIKEWYGINVDDDVAEAVCIGHHAVKNVGVPKNSAKWIIN